MNKELQASIQAEADQTEQAAKRIQALAKMVRTGQMFLEGLSSETQRAVRELLAGSPRGMTPQGFHAKQNAERIKFFKELNAQGIKAPRASQKDHDFIFDSILNTVDEGFKPAVKPMLRDYAVQKGYAPEWAERVATKNQPKKMGKSIQANKQHPVIKDLKSGYMLTQTHQSALKNATYSGLAELLFSGSQSSRQTADMRERLAALEAKLAVVEADADRANTRLNLMDAGLDWKEKARAILAVEADISKRELSRRVGQSEGAIRKYWTLLSGQPVCHAPA